MNWQKLVEIVYTFLQKYVTGALVSAFMKAVGWSSGFVSGILAWAIGKGLEKGAEIADSAARIEDQEALDEKLETKYQEDIKHGAPEPELIQDEEDILNGGRRLK